MPYWKDSLLLRYVVLWMWITQNQFNFFSLTSFNPLLGTTELPSGGSRALDLIGSSIISQGVWVQSGSFVWHTRRELTTTLSNWALSCSFGKIKCQITSFSSLIHRNDLPDSYRESAYLNESYVYWSFLRQVSLRWWWKEVLCL